MGALSGDVTRKGDFISSFVCSKPEEDASGIVTGEVKFRGNPELFTGQVRLEADDRGIGSFSLGIDLEGNYRDQFAGRLDRIGDFMRKLLIEIDGLEGAEPPSDSGYVGRGGAAMTIVKAFNGAGFDTNVRIDPFRALAAQPGHMRGYTHAEIHSAMEALKQTEPVDGLHVHVFVCSYLAGRGGKDVLGVMYDFGEADLNKKPREGVAVFYDHPALSDPRVSTSEREREYVFTLVHEIGHALNLLHSFDKARPSALSWMNYPHLYPRGYESDVGQDGTSEFWRHFPESFDSEEIMHLHHASPREIAAGGFSFGVYEEGASRPFGGTAEPRLTRPGGNPLRAMGDVELRVEPLKAEYALGEPVFVRIFVNNGGDRLVRVPDALDPSDGYVRLKLRSPSGRIIPYRPPIKLCRQAQLAYLPAKKQTQSFDGAPIFVSAAGPVFTEPGDYQLAAEMTGVDGSRVIYARPTTIRVAGPDRSTEKFAEKLWTEYPEVLRAMYLRHPLTAKEEWASIMDGPLPESRGNTTKSYLNYISAYGWMTRFAPGFGRREYGSDLSKAIGYADQINPAGLPGSVGRIKNDLKTEGAKQKQDMRSMWAPSARMRYDLPASGLFGGLALKTDGEEDGPPPVSAPGLSAERIVPRLEGSTRFADIVSWNIEHLHSRKDWERMPRVAELIRSFRCDFWGLQEVDAASLQELASVINSSGKTRYAYLATDGKGQQNGVLFRTDTTRVSKIAPSPSIAKLFQSKVEVTKRKGEKVQRSVFFREPLLLDVRVIQSSSLVYDFRCAVVHLKSTDSELSDTGSGLRAKAAEILAQWIAADREVSKESDYLILGDMNAETAAQGLAAYAERSDLRLLSVGMKEKYGPDAAITRVASKRLLDHIVITADSEVKMPEEDLSEQLIVRSDTLVSDWKTELSDHVPVAVRFTLGKDQD
ncbi:endonuclease/exonuclease/phosphatase family protein [Methyloceanibacter sp.]|uniref:endonuclease/exonuclease/phosphatase family protein n=1 Tax=Methyloceanibacter sp. TaxID=1965321 RepID=UPI003D6CE705